MAVRLTAVYAILLGMTALPLLFSLVAPKGIGRLACNMLTYVLMAGVVFLFGKDKKKIFADFGYSSYGLGKQVLTGLILSAATVLIFVVLPLAAGVAKEFVLMEKQTDILYIIGKIIFFMLFVGPIEEFVFRGFFQKHLQELMPDNIAVCFIASALFGLWHFPSTLNLINVACTFVIGLIYSISITKIKNCSVISVSLAHGLHDTVIFLLSCVLL